MLITSTIEVSNIFVSLHIHTGKYHDLERQLIQEFTAAQRRGEIGRMREVAAVLLHFKVPKTRYICFLDLIFYLLLCMINKILFSNCSEN